MSVLLWWQPSFSSSGEAGTKICKSPCKVIAVQGIFGPPQCIFAPPPLKVASILSENGTTVFLHDTPTLIC